MPVTLPRPGCVSARQVNSELPGILQSLGAPIIVQKRLATPLLVLKGAETPPRTWQVDPELLATFERLGVPLNEQKRLANVAVDAVFDSKSIATTFKKELQEHGVIFCSISEAVEHHPELVRKHLGSVVSPPLLPTLANSGCTKNVLLLCTPASGCLPWPGYTLPGQSTLCRQVGLDGQAAWPLHCGPSVPSAPWPCSVACQLLPANRPACSPEL